jgi:mRNA interferase RelE/StbE
MAYKIIIHRQAAKSLEKIPSKTRKVIYEKIKILSENPFDNDLDICKLKDRSGYRFRVGDWRVIYNIEKDKVMIWILNIDHRREVYR